MCVHVHENDNYDMKTIQSELISRVLNAACAWPIAYLSIVVVVQP